MSSKSLDNRTHSEKNAAPLGRVSADRVLMRLKNRGPQTAGDLGAALGITGEGCRQQLARLADEGLVASVSEARGVGRPSLVWRLTPRGNARFPDTHAELTVQLIDSVRSELGERALEQLVAARERTMEAQYAEAMKGAKGLKARIKRLVELRNRDGYMAEWTTRDGGYLLVENHCPICAAATACIGFCRSELEMFSKLLGPDVTVTRVEHLIEGARRCAYEITANSSPKKRTRIASKRVPGAAALPCTEVSFP
jgi:predicted ArsR family transcriptional regulator